MDKDELREKIDRIISRAESNSLAPEWQKSDYTAQILSLLAPELADAEKWRKFLAIPSCNDCPAYPECPCDETNCPAIKIENAFKGEGEKG